MPSITPITKTPYALLADAANIETAGKPGFEHIEKYSVARFSSISARNAAFSTVSPEVGQITYVSSLGHLGFEVWDGNAWVEFGEYTRTRTFYAFSIDNQSQSSTLFANSNSHVLSLSTGHYKIELDLYYAATSDRRIKLNFTFPGTSSRMSFGIIGRGSGASGDNSDASTTMTDASATRTSGDVAFDGLSGTGTSDVLYANCSGYLDLRQSGDLQLQFARDGSSGEVILSAGTILSATKIG